MGERFGWSQTSEKKDEVLNMTFDYAIENHPNMQWIDKYRYDSSVTQVTHFSLYFYNPQKDNGKEQSVCLSLSREFGSFFFIKFNEVLMFEF